MSSTKNKESNLLHAAHEMQDNLNVAASNAGRKVRSMFNSANDEIKNASDTVASEIRANPVLSSAIALGAGLIIGLILRPSAKQEK